MRRYEVLDSKHTELPFFLKEQRKEYQTGKSHLSDLLDFHDKITGFVEEGRAMDVTLARPFNIVLHNIVVSQSRLYSLHGWTNRCIKKWMVRLSG